MKDKIAAVNNGGDGDGDDHLPQHLQPGRPVDEGRRPSSSAGICSKKLFSSQVEIGSV